MHEAPGRLRLAPHYPFSADGRRYMMVLPSAAIVEIDDQAAEVLARIDREGTVGCEALAGGDGAILQELAEFGTLIPSDLPEAALSAPVPSGAPVGALAVAISERCNLACSYCYATDVHRTGGAQMDAAVGASAVDFLFAHAQAGDLPRVDIAFFGGEPLLNRSLIRQMVAAAEQRSRETGIRACFSITTNGTLLDVEAARFFRAKGFAITISLDGAAEEHDRIRPFRAGGGSFAAIRRNLPHLFAADGPPGRVSARVTVTRSNLGLSRSFDALRALGFTEVGFSPVTASAGEVALDDEAMDRFGEGMLRLGERSRDALLDGSYDGFSNLGTTLAQIHAGMSRPYPCGAAVGYFGVGPRGDLYTCHRFIGQPAHRVGDLRQGIDRGLQQQFLARSHIRSRPECSDCWARYLCAGGCYHEREAGDGHIRGALCTWVRRWLAFGLEAYATIHHRHPELLDQPLRPRAANGDETHVWTADARL